MKAMKMYKVLFGAMFGAVMALSSAGADEYPNRPIEIIVPYSPGGAADTIARPFVAALQKELKQGIGNMVFFIFACAGEFVIWPNRFLLIFRR